MLSSIISSVLNLNIYIWLLFLLLVDLAYFVDKLLTVLLLFEYINAVVVDFNEVVIMLHQTILLSIL